MALSEDQPPRVDLKIPSNDDIVESFARCLTFSSAFTHAGFETISDTVLKEMNERARHQLERQNLSDDDGSSELNASPTSASSTRTRMPSTPTLKPFAATTSATTSASASPVPASISRSVSAQISRPSPKSPSTRSASHSGSHMHDFQRMTKSPPESRFTAAHNRVFAHSEPSTASAIAKRTGEGEESPSKRRRAPDGRSSGLPNSPTSSLKGLHLAQEEDRLTKSSAVRNRDRQKRDYSSSPRRRSTKPAMPAGSIMQQGTVPDSRPPDSRPPDLRPPAPPGKEPRALPTPYSSSNSTSRPRQPSVTASTTPFTTATTSTSSATASIPGSPNVSRSSHRRASTQATVSAASHDSKHDSKPQTIPLGAGIPGAFPGMFSRADRENVSTHLRSNGARSLSNPLNKVQFEARQSATGRITPSTSSASLRAAASPQVSPSHQNMPRSSSTRHTSLKTSINAGASITEATKVPTPSSPSIPRSKSVNAVPRSSSQRRVLTPSNAPLMERPAGATSKPPPQLSNSPFSENLPSYARPTQAALRRSESIQPHKHK